MSVTERCLYQPPPSDNSTAMDNNNLDRSPSASPPTAKEEEVADMLDHVTNQLAIVSHDDRDEPIVEPDSDDELSVDKSAFTMTTTPSDSNSTAAMTTTAELTRSLTLTRHQDNEESAQVETRTEVINITTPNPSHLFWMPADQHPEIAPAEFEKYLTSHGLTARGMSEAKRRASILSVSFTANDDEEDIENQPEGIAKLSKPLQELALPPSEHNDRKMMIRRSISMQSLADMARLPDSLIFDRHSSPLDESQVLVPNVGRSLLRRGAQTKFRRNSSHTATQAVRAPPPMRKSDPTYSDPKQGPVQLCDDPVMFDPETPSIPPPDTTSILPLQELDEAPDRQTASAPPSPSHPMDSSFLPSPSLAPTPTPTRSTSERTKISWSWASFWSDDKTKKSKASSSPSSGDEATSSASEDPTPQHTTPSTTKRFALSSLFSRKSTKTDSLPSFMQGSSNVPKDWQLNKFNQSRLPLHIERAIYRYSHIKLANPRRPLHEQVLISNFMFWYLSIVSSGNGPNGEPVVQDPNAMGPKANKKALKSFMPMSKKKQPRHHKGFRSPAQMAKAKDTNVKRYMNGSRDSTGFVVPQNYLHPQDSARANKQRMQIQRRASLDDDSDSEQESESDLSTDEDEDEGEDERDEEDGMESSRKPEPGRDRVIPHSQRPMPGRPARDQPLAAKEGGHREALEGIGTEEEEDDVPLALYKTKGK